MCTVNIVIVSDSLVYILNLAESGGGGKTRIFSGIIGRIRNFGVKLPFFGDILPI